MNRFNTLKIALVTALGALAVLALPAAAAAKDRNHDRIPDRWEKRHHLSLAVNQAGRDQDGDRLPNRGEFLAGDNPRNDDSDGDGIPDGEENAGKIQSFDPASGRLVIALFGEETVSGLVTEATEIECGHSSASASDMGSGGDEGEDGPGEHEGSEDGGCTTADLTEGAVVKEAELELEHGSATFEKVELAG
jgi:hypothetical protein